jgi:hypothetical protein
VLYIRGEDEMVKTSEASDYTQATDFKDGETVTIGDESDHKILEINSPEGGDKRKRLILKFRERDRPSVINNTSRKNIEGQYGTDSAKWVDKKVITTVATQNVRGTLMKVLYFHPIHEKGGK